MSSLHDFNHRIKTFAHSKVKRGDWTGRRRGKVGQPCPSTETGGGSGLGYGRRLVPTVPHLIKQSTTASSRKATVLTKNVTKLDIILPSSRYPSLNKPKFWAIINWNYWRGKEHKTLCRFSGDVVPMTILGKCVGSLCAVIGLVFWSIPMTFVSDKFDVYRRLYKDRDYLMGLLQKLKKEAQDELLIA